jgi:serine/threonine protein kinase
MPNESKHDFAPHSEHLEVPDSLQKYIISSDTLTVNTTVAFSLYYSLNSHLFKAVSTVPLQGESKVVVKVMGNSHPSKISKEAMKMRDLRSPYLVKFLGIVSTDWGMGIVMPHYQADLHDVLLKAAAESKPISTKQKLLWARDASYGLRHIHRLGYLHCDIKSYNLFIDAENNLKVGDFDSAHPIKKLDKLKNSRGTPQWRAPELFNNSINTTASDIYSLGCVFWELEANGKMPFDGAKYKLGKKKQNYQHESLEGCSPYFKSLISACWNNEPSQRLSIQEICNRLDLELKKYVHEEMFDQNDPAFLENTLLDYLQGHIVSSDQLTFDNKNIICMLDERGRDQKIYTGKLTTPEGEKKISIKGQQDPVEDPSNIIFYKNAIKMKWLESAYTIKLIASAEYKDVPCVIMDYYHSNLANFLKISEFISREQKLKMARDICYGLNDLHNKGYAHGSLLSQNILLDVNNNPKIGNLENARCMSKLDNVEEQKDDVIKKILFQHETQKEMTEDPSTIATDIYDLGTILWQLEMKTPISGNSLRYSCKEGRSYHQFASELDSCSPLFKSLISACWNEDPSKRPSIKNICDQLDLALKQFTTIMQDRKKEAKESLLSLSFFSYPIPSKQLFDNLNNSLEKKKENTKSCPCLIL